MIRVLLLISITKLFLIVFYPVVIAREIGKEVCSCSPSSFEFTLDFSLSCPPVNVTIGNAVEATSCLVSPFGNPNVDDLVPVVVERIDILEMNQELRVTKQTSVKESFRNGDTLTYNSINANPAAIYSDTKITKAIQLNMLGTNLLGQKLINVFIITYTNSCENYPVLEKGQSAGWVRFTGIGSASYDLCPAAPTIIPSTSPPLLLSLSSTSTVTMYPSVSSKFKFSTAIDTPTEIALSSPNLIPQVTSLPTDRQMTAISSNPTLAPLSKTSSDPLSFIPTISPDLPIHPVSDNPTSVQFMAITQKENTGNPMATVQIPTGVTKVPLIIVPTMLPMGVMSMSMSMSLDSLKLNPSGYEFGSWKQLRARKMKDDNDDSITNDDGNRFDMITGRYNDKHLHEKTTKKSKRKVDKSTKEQTTWKAKKLFKEVKHEVKRYTTERRNEFPQVLRRNR